MSKGIVFKNLSVTYPDNKKPTLRGINLFIPKGSLYGIIGANGSGKTTLVQTINGLIPHETGASVKGEVLIDGESTKNRSVSYFSKKVGMVFQNPDLMIFNLTVAEEVSFGLDSKDKKIKNKIRKALADVGLSKYEKRDPQTLSFGQKQKLCLAAVLARNPEYVVFDEPTAMLDYQSSHNLFSLLKKLQEKGKTVIVVEHDTDLILKYATDVVVLQNGMIADKGIPSQILFKNKLMKQTGIKKPVVNHD